MRICTLLILLLTAGTLGACATRADHYLVGPGTQRLSKSAAESELILQSLHTQIKPPLDAPLRMLQVKLPVYPDAWKRRDTVPEHKVTVAFTVLQSGAVAKAEIRGPANPQLAALCLHAIQDWRFEPARRSGKALSAGPLTAAI